MKKEIVDGINFKYKHVLLACCGLLNVEVVDELFQAIEQLQDENEKLKLFKATAQDMYPKRMCIVDGAVEMAIESLKEN